MALRGKSRPLKRSEQRAAGSGKCLGRGRGCCALLGGLRRGGAARPWRRGALLRRGGRGGVEPGFGAALAGRVRAQGVAGWLKGLAEDLGERAQGRVPRGSRPAISAVTGAGASGEKGLTWGPGCQRRWSSGRARSAGRGQGRLAGRPAVVRVSRLVPLRGGPGGDAVCGRSGADRYRNPRRGGPSGLATPIFSLSSLEPKSLGMFILTIILVQVLCVSSIAKILY